jgi:hypothetical protein
MYLGIKPQTYQFSYNKEIVNMALTKQISSRSLILSPTSAEVTTAQTISPYYEFRVSGVLELPKGGYFDCGRYAHADQHFASAKISVRIGGASQYNIIVKSYDNAGGGEKIHINLVNQQFTTDNTISTLTFTDAAISAERTLVLYIKETTAGTSVEDFSLTLVSGLFASLEAIGDTTSNAVKGPPLINTQAFTLVSSRALAITPSGVTYSSADNIPSTHSCIGISTANTSPSGSINLVSSGLAISVLSGLGFSSGDEIYLGLNGNLVNATTASAFPSGYALKQLGFAINSIDMWVQVADAEIIL